MGHGVVRLGQTANENGNAVGEIHEGESRHFFFLSIINSMVPTVLEEGGERDLASSG